MWPRYHRWVASSAGVGTAAAPLSDRLLGSHGRRRRTLQGRRGNPVISRCRSRRYCRDITVWSHPQLAWVGPPAPPAGGGSPWYHLVAHGDIAAISPSGRILSSPGRSRRTAPQTALGHAVGWRCHQSGPGPQGSSRRHV